MFAFLPSLGYQEMFLLVVIGLLLYGRNLPEAGRSLGRVAAQLRRGWNEFKDQMDRDGDLREVKKSLQDTKEELKRVAAVPRAIADPRRAAADLARDAMASPPADEKDEASAANADGTSSESAAASETKPASPATHTDSELPR